MKIKHITLAEVEFLSWRLAQETMDWSEPIPNFNSRFPGILESCLAVPFSSFDGCRFYRGLVNKAGVLFYTMIKNHPFQNGNKRIAMTTLFIFLSKNKKWLKVNNQELYNFARWVAESNPKLKKETIQAVEKFIRTYLING